jgi:hypothetical protein
MKKPLIKIKLTASTGYNNNDYIMDLFKRNN